MEIINKKENKKVKPGIQSYNKREAAWHHKSDWRDN